MYNKAHRYGKYKRRDKMNRFRKEREREKVTEKEGRDRLKKVGRDWESPIGHQQNK